MSHDPVETPEQEATNHGHSHHRLSNAPFTREERELAKKISLEVFGKSNAYKKLYEQQEMLTHMVDEVVPGENGEPDTTKKVRVPLFAKGTTKVKQYKMIYRNDHEVMAVLKDVQKQRNEYITQMMKQQAEAKAKADAEAQAKKLQEEVGGSALT
jgi:hypothetical protein